MSSFKFHFILFKGLTLEESTFVGKFVTCTAGYISTNNNQSCGKNPGINYKATNGLEMGFSGSLKIHIQLYFLQKYVQPGHIITAQPTNA